MHAYGNITMCPVCEKEGISSPFVKMSEPMVMMLRREIPEAFFHISPETTYTCKKCYFVESIEMEKAS